MKKLYFFSILFFFAGVPFAFAIPDASAFVWLTNVENPPFDNDGILTVNWEPVINEDIVRYNINVGDAVSGQMLFLGTNTTVNTFLFSGYVYGNYTFRVTAINSLGEEGLGTLSEWVYIDTTDPTITFIAPTPENNAYTKNNWTTLSVSVTDFFLDSVIIDWNGVDTLFNDPSGVIRSYPPEMPAPGKYSYYVWANDSAGNSINSELRYITYDIIKPLVSLISPQNGVVYNTSSIPLEYNANDTSLITCWYEYNLVNTTLSDCRNTNFNPTYSNKTNLTLWVSDAAGNINSALVSFTVNAPTAPEIISTIPVNGKVLDAPSISGKFTDVVSITTDKAAQCRYSTTANTSFDSMTYWFEDVKNNAQNATITLVDKTVYTYYIKCRSIDNVVNFKDYVLQFSTAASEGLIILDPNSTVLKNNVLRIELIKGLPSRINLPVKTNAAYDLDISVGFSYLVSGEVAPFVSVQFPAVITKSKLSNITIAAFPSVLGLSKTNITIIVGGYSTVFEADIYAYDDFYSELNAIEQNLLNVSSRIEILNSSGTNVVDKIVELEKLKSEIADIRLLYGSERYIESRENFLKLNSSFNIFKEELMQAEDTRNIVDDVSKEDSGSSSGIGGISLSTIVIVIIVVIIVIIMAASYVPDSGEKTVSVSASQNPGNEGFQISSVDRFYSLSGYCKLTFNNIS